MKQFVLLLLVLLILCKAENDNIDDNDELSQIILMSYNVMFVPRLIVQDRDQITRAHLLTKAKFLRISDILCLEEVFQPEPTKILLDSLSETYPYSTPILGNEEEQSRWNEVWNSEIGRSSLKFLSGGLKILSKWPITYAAQYFHQYTCGAHTFVRSGFIYTRILYGTNSIPVHVIGIHLQPSGHPGCYLLGEEQARLKQMQEISSFINTRNISENELLFLLGDFNVDKYNTQQYRTMTDKLNVEEQSLHPSSIPCTWDSSFNAMTKANHKQNQLLDYIFIHKNHTLNNSEWYNFIIDAMASDQWHLLGKSKNFHNNENIPLMELSDHYPVAGFFNLTKYHWPEKSVGTITYVQFFTADTDLPVINVGRNLLIGTSSNDTAALFILTNNGTPRRHRCLKSEQHIILIDANQTDFYLSDSKLFRMKYGIKHINRYLRIFQMDNTTKCITTNSTFILQTRLSTGYYYVTQKSSQLCSCTKDRNAAQVFRLIEVERKSINCTITH